MKIIKPILKTGLYVGITLGSFMLGKSCQEMPDSYKVDGLEFRVDDNKLNMKVEVTNQDYQLVFSKNQPYWIQTDTTLTVEQQQKLKGNLERITGQINIYNK